MTEKKHPTPMTDTVSPTINATCTNNAGIINKLVMVFAYTPATLTAL